MSFERLSDARASEVASQFDLNKVDASFLENPYPVYDALRRYDPVRELPDGTFFVSRYRDLVTVLQDPERYSSDKRVDFKPKFGDSPLYEHHTTSVVFNDPPYHTRVRSLLTPFFSPQATKVMKPRVEALVDRLLDRAEEHETFDVVGDFATALPVNLIGDMLGVPEDERSPMREWATAILGALEPALPEEKFRRGCEAVDAFKAYLKGLIQRKRRSRDRSDGADVLHALVDATDLDGDFGELELLHNCIFLLNAGHDTTTSMIANGVNALFRFPDQSARLRDDPGLMDTAVEEILRLESPLQIGNRKLMTDHELGGRSLPKGAFLHIGIASANHDPDSFEDSESLDIGRWPNKHLAFGKGIHTCAGNSLGRMEGVVALSKLIARFPNLKPNGTLERGARARFRTIVSFPVEI